MTTNPQSEVKCNGSCCKKNSCYLTCSCHHPKESPVSQSVESLPSGEGVSKSRKLAQTLLGGIQYGDERDNPEWRLKVMDGAEAYIDDFLKDSLSTLVKEMEGLISQLCECQFPDEQMNRCRNCKKIIEDKRTANAGISAAVEVVNRLNK